MSAKVLRVLGVVFGGLLAGAAGADAGTFTDAAQKAAQSISGADMRAVVSEIAGDAYAGRGPGEPGDPRTRAWLAAELKKIGFAPGAEDGAWQQPFDLVGIKAAQPARWAFSRGDQTLELAQGSEFIVSSGVQAERVAIADAELVFAGYGIQAPEYQWDDFKGVDLKGKVLVILNNDPHWDPDLFAGKRRLYYGRWTYKYEIAARQGAVGAIIIHTTPSAGYPWQVVETSWTGTQFELPAGDELRVQIPGWVTYEAALKLFALAGQDLEKLTAAARSRDFKPIPLGVRTSMELKNTLSRVKTANVLGLLKGSDPALANEVIVYSAHHDHLGVGMAKGGREDRTYNGAPDNPAGVGVVLSIARAFASLPQAPRRSILIALVAAEEQGLLGSKYYAQHPSFAAGRIAAVINYDSPNIWGATKDVTFIGLGKSSLDEVARRVATHQGRTLKPDQFPDRGTYYRSDQFSFARVGVPGLYVKGGTDFIGRPAGWGAAQINTYTAKNYHQPSDELTDDWNFEGMVLDARFGFWAGQILANADEMPAWVPGDEFEPARRQALRALKK